MGWGSGTPIFDDVAKVVMKRKITQSDKKIILKTLVNAMRDQDWDCEGDSDFYDDPFIRKEIFCIEDDDGGE